MTPLDESGGAVGFEFLSAAETVLLVEMVVDRGVDAGESHMKLTRLVERIHRLAKATNVTREKGSFAECSLWGAHSSQTR